MTSTQSGTGSAAAPPWRPLRAVTLDLWGTLIDSRDPLDKIERRRELLLAAIRAAGHTCDVDQLRAGFRAARPIIDDVIVRERRDIGPEGRWQELMTQLGFPLESVPFERVLHAYEDLTVEYLPALLDGVEDAVEQLAGNYPLGLICNTGYTGGKVLRQVLERRNIIKHFKVLTFSNEYGWLKPDPRIFHHTVEQLGVEAWHALHIGDTESMDIAGAREAGMYSARYLPEHEGDDMAVSEADLVFSDWSELMGLLDERQRDARD